VTLVRRDDKQPSGTSITGLVDVLEKCFVVVALFLFTGALIPLLRLQSGASQDLIQGDPVSQAVFLGIYGIAFAFILRRWKQFIQVATRDKLLLLLVGVALVSVLWSYAPAVTLRRDVAMLGTTLFGAYFATRYEPREQLRLLAWALGIAALLSLVFALAIPSYGIVYDEVRGESWQGIYGGGKNVLGRVMALSVLVFLLLALGKGKNRLVSWAGLGLSVTLLLMSNSVTSQLCVLTVVLLLPLYGALRWRYALATSFFVLAMLVGGGVASWVAANAELLLSSAGRDLTLTARTDLWPAVIEMIRQRPWLGYGYGAFWLGWTGESAHVWLWNARIGLEALHAHNGILEMWLNVGLIGLSVFVLQYLLAAGRAVSWILHTEGVEGLWPLAYMTFMLFYNISENALLANNDVFWVLYVAVVLSTASRLSEARKTYNPRYL
jgi:exopolysaccharide production protein ExoQ